METQVMATIESRLAKVRGRHLSLAARVTVANGLILSSIWYIVTLWAGDLSFLQRYSGCWKPLFGPGALGSIVIHSVKVRLGAAWVCVRFWNNIGL